MLHYCFTFIITLSLAFIMLGCKEKENADKNNNPAEQQIREYTARLKKCEQEKQQLMQQKDDLIKQHVTVNNNIDTATTIPTVKTLEHTEIKDDKPAIITRSLSKPFKDDMVLGEESGKGVVVIEYFSPTCPHCAYYETKILPKLQEKYLDNKLITYVIREFIGNKQDLDAALLARCNGNKESFFKFVKIILEQQGVWSINKNYRDLLTNIGTLGGVAPEVYAKCLTDDQLAQTLIENTKLVSSIPSFVGTPAFFINGVPYRGAYSLEELSKAIDKAMLDRKSE